MVEVLVAGDSFVPEVKTGDSLVVMKKNAPIYEIKAGSTVVYHREDKPHVAKVSRVEGDIVWAIGQDEAEIELTQADIVGTLAHVMSSD